MSYQGLAATIPVGQQGFSGSRNPSQMQPGHLSYVDGMTYDGGVIRKEGGAQKMNAAALGAPSVVVSGISWNVNLTTQYDIVFLNNGSVLRDTNGAGTFGTTYVSGLTDARSPPPQFVLGGGEVVGQPSKLLMFSATNQVQIVAGTGATMAAISTPPADWGSSFPPFGVLHGGRMWGGGQGSDPHRIYYSTLASHQDFTSAGAGTLAIFPGEGTALVAGVSFRGLLVLFKKPKGVYVVNTADATPANWSVHKLSGAVGSISGQTVFPIENDVLFMDQGGNIRLLSATQLFGDLNTDDLGQLAEISTFIRANANLSAIYRAGGIWYPTKRQAWFTFCGVGETNNNIRVIVDFQNLQSGPRFLVNRRDVSVSMWVRYDDTTTIALPVVGDASGFVWELDQPARDKAGVGYPFIMETANTDLGFLDPQIGPRMKSGQFLELVSEPAGNWDLDVEVYWDDELTDTVQYSMGAGGSPLGTFVLGTDTLSSTSVRSQRKRIVGSGRRLKLRASNLNVGEDVALAEFILSFEVADERTRDA